MATSFSTTWEMSANEIVAASLRKLQAVAKGQVPDAEDYQFGLQALNGLISLLVTEGLTVWSRETSIVPLETNISIYSVPSISEVVGVYIRNSSGNSQYPLNPTPYNDFLYLAPAHTGVPTAFTTYQDLQTKYVQIWPKPDATASAEYQLITVFQRKYFNVTDGTQTLDFPSYWELAIIYGLAVLLAPEYGVPPNDLKALAEQSEKYKQQALDYSNEDQSVFIHPTREF